jgi:hypothetical protein
MTATVSPFQRFSKDHPCPICDGHPGLPRGHGVRCTGYQNGDYVRCSREERAGTLPRNDDDTYSHLLTGPCRCGRTHGEPAGAATEAKPSPDPRPRVLRPRRWEHGCIDGEPIAHLREDLSTGEKRVWWERGGKSGLRGVRVADLPLYGSAGLKGGPAVIVVEGEPATDAGKGMSPPVVGRSPAPRSRRLMHRCGRFSVRPSICGPITTRTANAT